MLISFLVVYSEFVATTNGKAIFTNPVPIYVGDTGDIKIVASIPLNYNYTLSWTYNNQYTAANSTTLVLDIVDPTIGDSKPILIYDKLSGSDTSYVWFVDPTKFKGDVTGYQFRLYDSTCAPPKCVLPALGRLVISASQPFIIYNPPDSVQDNPLINSSDLLNSCLYWLILFVFQ
eukprot:NODE_182_length_15748_cov_0.173174.p9 type:complete len:175 gc:universal NODE_182_length_15748_cov_0.173174:1969-2493(+)